MTMRPAGAARRRGGMFDAVAPSSRIAIAVLIACFGLVLAFAFSNGFHDTVNAAATVIYNHSLTADFSGLPVRPTHRPGW